MTKNRLKNKISNLFYDFSLIGLGFLIIFLIVLLKSKTSSDFWSSPLLLIYTIFITSFELSRLINFKEYSHEEISNIWVELKDLIIIKTKRYWRGWFKNFLFYWIEKYN